ncbi:response regulator [Sorangium cellulosum]|uniref:Response regulator n=1 Tax=Sorangium cellulosum TaxID=56 RepID=A0A150PU26_SORCE|nr:response regulator [Sorangium cellulosum]
MTRDPESPHALQGLRVLIVEDEPMIASSLEDALTDLGCVVIGPALNMRDAIRLAREAEIDGATLDVNIAGEKVYAVADILMERGIPFVFTTGYGKAGLRESDLGRPVLQKPYNLNRFVEIVTRWR